MQNIQTITPCLWFDNQAEEAAEFYTAIFRNSKISRRVMTAMLQMKKIDIDKLKQAAAGQ